MAERSQRYDSRDRRGSSSRSSSYDRSSRRGSGGSRNVSSGRRRDMGSIRDERRRNGTPSERRLRSTSAQRRNASRSRDGRMRTPTPQGGYELRSHPINFAGKRNSYDPQLIIVAGVAIAIFILFIFFIVSCAASCGSGGEPTANVSESLSGDLRSSVEKMVTSDYQSTFVAEHADQYPTELIQLMVNEPASTEFVYNYPNASREAQPYEDQVAKGSVPLLYDWDARWGYVEYAGGLLGVNGSGPTSVAMARMALLGAGDATPATVASYVSQLGGATGDTFMDPSLFGSTSAADTTGTTAVDEDGDGYDDNTGDYVGDTTKSGDDSQTGDGATDAKTSDQSLASMLGIEATSITVEPGSSVTDTLLSALEDGSYVLVQTSDGAFGTTPHWALVIGVNSDGSLGVYDPTSVANSLHPWDPGTVVDGSSALIALSAPGGSSDEKSGHVDEDGDGYDDDTGEYVGTEDDSSSN